MDSRDKILEAALRVFAEAGTRGATTRRIAEEAGVNEVTLFRHFGSKARLLREAFRHATSSSPPRGLPEEPADPEEELTRWARTQLDHLLEVRSLIRTSMGEFEEHPYVRSAVCEAPRRVANELDAYLLRLRARGLVAPDCDTRAACPLLLGAIFSDAMGRDMMPERFPDPPQVAAAKYVRLFLRAVGTGERRTLDALPNGARNGTHEGTLRCDIDAR